MPQPSAEQEEYELNYGMQPLSLKGGILRLILKLKGEDVTACYPVIGFNHKGMEKIFENKTFTEISRLLPRLDSLNGISCNYSFILALEKLANITVPKRASLLRVIFAEIVRIQNHMRIIAAMAQDLGSDIPFLHMLKQQKIIKRFLSNRQNFYTIGGINFDISEEILSEIYRWANDNNNSFLEKADYLLTENRIFKDRTIGIGVISLEDALDWGLTGPALRACGYAYDIRKKFPYDAYERIDFRIPTQTAGDCYSRYLLRIEEIKESFKIITSAINLIPNRNLSPDDNDICKSPEFYIPAGEIYTATESPRGELGVYLLTDGRSSPYRIHLKTPSFDLIQALQKIAKDCVLSDMVAIIGSLDINMEEADR